MIGKAFNELDSFDKFDKPMTLPDMQPENFLTAGELKEIIMVRDFSPTTELIDLCHNVQLKYEAKQQKKKLQEKSAIRVLRELTQQELVELARCAIHLSNPIEAAKTMIAKYEEFQAKKTISVRLYQAGKTILPVTENMWNLSDTYPFGDSSYEWVGTAHELPIED